MSFHGDIHERIQQISKEIENNPDDVNLYLKRGELYFQHEAYDSSSFDFKTCELLGNYPAKRFYFSYAKTLNQLDRHGEALIYLKKILKIDPGNVNTLRLIGKIYNDLSKPCIASEYLQKVISNASYTLPFNYLEASRSFSRCDHPDALNKSIDILNQGINDLGALITFQNELVKIFLENNMVNEAIDIQTQIIQSATRKEFPLYKRAKFYKANGNIELAEKDIQDAKILVSKLPERIRLNKATRELMEKLSDLIK